MGLRTEVDPERVDLLERIDAVDDPAQWILHLIQIPLTEYWIATAAVLIVWPEMGLLHSHHSGRSQSPESPKSQLVKVLKGLGTMFYQLPVVLSKLMGVDSHLKRRSLRQSAIPAACSCQAL